VKQKQQIKVIMSMLNDSSMEALAKQGLELLIDGTWVTYVHPCMMRKGAVVDIPMERIKEVRITPPSRGPLVLK